ncbi:MAG: ATP-binding protein, partial [Xanthomonadaceae bacterium]|nr:ATP-binding protein [Xanthomonadaceae bacterium]
PFYRAENESGSLRRSDGHGIGLSIVQRLSQRFGWPVRMESTAGSGTVVRVSFPIASSADG